jgi:hypothetical protein
MNGMEHVARSSSRNKENLVFANSTDPGMRNSPLGSAFSGLGSSGGSLSMMDRSQHPPKIDAMTASEHSYMTHHSHANLYGSPSNESSSFDSLFNNLNATKGMIDAPTPTPSLNASLDAQGHASLLSASDPETNGNTRSPLFSDKAPGSPLVVSPKCLSPTRSMSPKPFGAARSMNTAFETKKKMDTAKEKLKTIIRKREDEFIEALAILLVKDQKTPIDDLNTVDQLVGSNSDHIVAAFRQLTL